MRKPAVSRRCRRCQPGSPKSDSGFARGFWSLKFCDSETCVHDRIGHPDQAEIVAAGVVAHAEEPSWPRPCQGCSTHSTLLGMSAASPALIGRLVSVNVGVPRSVEWQGRRIRTAIWKDPVDGPVEVRGVNMAGDDQADRRVHGGTDKAVYAYGAEDYAWWSDQLGIEIGPGWFGDNLTIEGFDLRTALVGERWRIGTCMLEVSEPRMPCFKLGIRMGSADFVDLFAVVARFGTYLRIVEEGTATAGDDVFRASRPAVELTVADLAESQTTADSALLERVASHPAVSAKWSNRARRSLRRSERQS